MESKVGNVASICRLDLTLQTAATQRTRETRVPQKACSICPRAIVVVAVITRIRVINYNTITHDNIY